MFARSRIPLRRSYSTRSCTSDSLDQWMRSDRFRHVVRPYTPKQVQQLQPEHQSIHLSNFMSKKLYSLLRNHQQNGTATSTFGSLDPVQVVQMAPHTETIYVSGWQAASTAASSNEPGPDYADYPYDTVPKKVDQLVKALQFHDRKQKIISRKQQTESNVDYYRPIIADADAGHGGLTSVMKLTKLFIESGAAGIHLEDQRAGAKRCGHLGGKVLVPIQEHIQRLIAARLQADIMENDMVLVARTDAESGCFIDNNMDIRDHPFILGRLMYPHGSIDVTFPDAVEKLYAYENCSHEYRREKYTGYFQTALERARKDVSTPFSYSWEPLRTAEGFYRVKNGIEYSIARAKAYAPYADILWMETTKPDLSQAQMFAESIRKHYPSAMMAYNLSPSFNWDAMKMSDSVLQEFIPKLAQMGFVWQFITLAGFHVNGLAMTQFARNYGKDGMLAYVRDIQRVERENNVSLLKHQQWSGVDLADEALSVITQGTASTMSTGTNFTETQFVNNKV